MKKIVISFFVFSFWLLISPTEILAQTANLSLSPSTGNLNLGCNFPLDVNLDTGGAQTDGTDAIIFYDPSRLNAVSITNGSIYPDFPGNNIDSQTGKITISGLAAVSTPFSGKGKLATVNFTVKSDASVGSTQITFDFDPNNKGKTTDSNVVERTTVVDVLNAVTPGSYVVGTGKCGSPSTTPRPIGGFDDATPAASAYVPPKPLPDAGTPELTSTLAIFGGILTVLGILGLALL